MSGLVVPLIFPIALLAWGLATAKFLPWWWANWRGEEAALSKQDKLLIIGGYALFLAVICMALATVTE